VTPLLITPHDLFYGPGDKYHIDVLYRVLFLLRHLLAVVMCFRCRSEILKPGGLSVFLGAFTKQMRKTNRCVTYVYSMLIGLSVRMGHSNSERSVYLTVYTAYVCY
jgi:hypothetical protein